MKIKNVIFDLGQVLVRFDPGYMVKRYVTDPDDAALLASVVFDRLYWDGLDAGTVSDGEVLAAVKERLPSRLHADAERIYNNWIYNLPPMPGMEELLHRLKAKGARLFLLSNTSTYLARHASEIPILGLMEGCVFSAECGMLKPDPAIYLHLCSRFGIIPWESVFVDDRAENTAAARGVGMDACLFAGDTASLQDYLLSVIVG